MLWTGLQTVSVTVRPADATSADGLEALLAFVAFVADADVGAVRAGQRCPHCGATDHGRPWATVDGSEVGVSLARTPGHLAMAVGPGAVGVDVERRSRVEAAALDAFTDAERSRGSDRTALWAVKEAVLKRDGRGLRVDPREVDVVVTPDPGTDRPEDWSAAVAWTAGGPVEARVWAVDADVVVAVATTPGVPVVRAARERSVRRSTAR